jgi:hypothetical protein
MRVALAMIPLLTGCSELDPGFSTAQWFDGVEETRPTEQGLHTDFGGSAPGLWARSTNQTKTGESSWHFGDGVTYPMFVDASLRTPEFEAGRTSFLRFSYWCDVQPFSESTAKDGAVIEAQVANGDWILLEPEGGYPYTLDESAVGSQLGLREGLFSGTDREWHDDYVELTEAEPGDAIRFRFRFATDIDTSNNMGEGLYIDDVEFLIVE